MSSRGPQPGGRSASAGAAHQVSETPRVAAAHPPAPAAGTQSHATPRSYQSPPLPRSSGVAPARAALLGQSLRPRHLLKLTQPAAAREPPHARPGRPVIGCQVRVQGRAGGAHAQAVAPVVVTAGQVSGPEEQRRWKSLKAPRRSLSRPAIWCSSDHSIGLPVHLTHLK